MDYSIFMGNSLSQIKQFIKDKENAAEVSLVTSFMVGFFQTITTLTRAGDEILVGMSGDSEFRNHFNSLFQDIGIYSALVKSTSSQDYKDSISVKTRLILLITRPGTEFDYEGIASIAHEFKIPLVVVVNDDPDYTITPLNRGADIVIRDLSCYTDGKIKAGYAAESGNFDWITSNVPLLKVADPCAGDIRWVFDLPESEVKTAFTHRFNKVFCNIFETSLSESAADFIKLPQ